jgi:hypothetical protein
MHYEYHVIYRIIDILFITIKQKYKFTDLYAEYIYKFIY